MTAKHPFGATTHPRTSHSMTPGIRGGIEYTNRSYTDSIHVTSVLNLRTPLPLSPQVDNAKGDTHPAQQEPAPRGQFEPARGIQSDIRTT